MFDKAMNNHLECFEHITSMKDKIIEAGNKLGGAIKKGKKILICGNGGSAADAQHFAAEIVGRFEKERRAWPAIALTTDTSILTAITNDYNFTEVFARQVEAHGTYGDYLIGISTSGNSLNVINAINKAKNTGMNTIALLGRDGGKIKEIAEEAIVLPIMNTARIQEGHIFILHLWADIIETLMTQSNY